MFEDNFPDDDTTYQDFIYYGKLDLNDFLPIN